MELSLYRVYAKQKTLKSMLQQVNDYMDSYKQRLTIAREQLEFVQGKMKGQVPDNMLIEQEKKQLLEVEKWNSFEKQVI